MRLLLVGLTVLTLCTPHSANSAMGTSRCQVVLAASALVLGVAGLAVWVGPDANVAGRSIELQRGEAREQSRADVNLEGVRASSVRRRVVEEPAEDEESWPPVVLPYEGRSIRDHWAWVDPEERHLRREWRGQSHQWSFESALLWLRDPVVMEWPQHLVSGPLTDSLAAIERQFYRGVGAPGDREEVISALKLFESREISPSNGDLVALMGRLSPEETADHLRSRARSVLQGFEDPEETYSLLFLLVELQKLETRNPGLDRTGSRAFLEPVVLEGSLASRGHSSVQALVDPFLFFYTDAQGESAAIAALRSRTHSPVQSQIELQAGQDPALEEATALRGALPYLDDLELVSEVYGWLEEYRQRLESPSREFFFLASLGDYQFRAEGERTIGLDWMSLDELLDLAEGEDEVLARRAKGRIGELFWDETLNPTQVTIAQTLRLIQLIDGRNDLERHCVKLVLMHFGGRPSRDVREALESQASNFAADSPLNTYLFSLAYDDFQVLQSWASVEDRLLVREQDFDLRWGYYDPIYEVLVGQILMQMDLIPEGDVFPESLLSQATRLLTRTPHRRALLLDGMRRTIERVGLPDLNGRKALEIFGRVAFSYGREHGAGSALSEREREEERWLMDQLLPQVEFPTGRPLPEKLWIMNPLNLLYHRLEEEGLHTPESQRLFEAVEPFLLESEDEGSRAVG